MESNLSKLLYVGFSALAACRQVVLPISTPNGAAIERLLVSGWPVCAQRGHRIPESRKNMIPNGVTECILGSRYLTPELSRSARRARLE